MNTKIVSLFLLGLYGPFLGLQAAEHTPTFGGRARLAGMEEAPDNKGATASLRLRLTIDSQWTDYVSSLLAVDHVTTALESQFSNGKRENGKPSVPDVEGLDLNQLALRFSVADGKVSLGRERIELDDQRFVGGNSFWQNEQTFDGLNVSYNLFSATKVFYAYINNVNRIFGDQSTPDLSPIEGIDAPRPLNYLGDHEHQTHLFHVNTQDWDYQELSVFYYDIDNKDAVRSSNRTFGFRHRYERRFGAFVPSVISSLAWQTRPEIEDSETAPYYLLDAGLGYKSFTASARYERLGTEDSSGFATPLSAAHDFHGWIDKFINVTRGPLNDTSLQFMWRKAPIKIDARYHWFGRNGSSDLGTEFDFDVIYKFNKKHRFLLRYAEYFSSTEYQTSLVDEKRVFFNYSFEL